MKRLLGVPRRFCSSSRSEFEEQVRNLTQQLSHIQAELHRLKQPQAQESYPVETDDYNDLPTFPDRPSFKEFQSNLQVASQCVVFDGSPDDPFHPSSTPIYQTSTFVQPSADEFGPYDYTRSGNPTRTALETQIAMLSQAHAAFCFTSGMCALMAMTRLLPAGSEMLMASDVYGGMHRLVMNCTRLHDVKVQVVDTTDLKAVKKAIKPGVTRLLHMESPSNPLMLISNIRELAELLHKNDVLLSIDNTMMPLLQNPLKLGADIEIHSLTKFYSGHADVMGGAVLVNDEALAQRIAFYQNAEGTSLAPFDCWVFLRGMKTLHLRLMQGQKSATEIANFLRDQEFVTEVFYPGLKPREGDSPTRKHFYEQHMSQATGGGCVMSFTTGDVEFSRRFINCLRMFKLTVSFGSVNSLCEMPCLLSHASIPEEERTIPEDLIRLSIGIEDVEDLKKDIAEAFTLAKLGSDFQISKEDPRLVYSELPGVFETKEDQRRLYWLRRILGVPSK